MAILENVNEIEERPVSRKAETIDVERNTKETQIRGSLRIEGRGTYNISTGIRFLDHMLELFTKHGGFDLTLQAAGDLDVDQHHTVEDCGIVLGQLFSPRRSATAAASIAPAISSQPMDETLAVVAVDLGGRPALVYKDLVKTRLVGDLQTELLEDFFGGFVNHAGANLHAKVLYGRSNHHKIEAIFKCFARAMRYACSKSSPKTQLLRRKESMRVTARRGVVRERGSMIAIFDYGAGNLQSVKNTLDAIGASYELVRDATGLRRGHENHPSRRGPLRPDHAGARRSERPRNADRTHPRRSSLPRHLPGPASAVHSRAKKRPEERGLGIFEGAVSAIPRRSADSSHGLEPSRTPIRRNAPASKAIGRQTLPLFRPQLLLPSCSSRRPATCDYIVPYTAVLEQENVSGVQFHPEKSGALGQSSRAQFRRGTRMLAKRIIPCLDVTAGRVVKGVNFVNLRDAGDPVELAARYNEQGADELVFLDITASSDDRDTMVDVVARTAREVFIPLTVGGGIRTVDDARGILHAGADKVSVNTAAVRRPNSSPN